MPFFPKKIFFFLSFLSWFLLTGFLFSEENPQQVKIISETTDSANKRIYKNMEITENGETVRFSLGLPLSKKKNLPAVIILSGLETGQKNIEYIPPNENILFIGFEYPSIIKELKNSIPYNKLLSARKALLKIPENILTVKTWIEQQPYHDKKNISVAGYSYGGMLIPVIYYKAQKKAVSLGPGVIGYAGADLYPLLYANIAGNRFIKTIKALFGTLLFYPIKPSLYLKKLKNDFLIINGIDDTAIPFKQAQKLQKMIPGPKTIINLESEHMSLQNKELLKKIIQISEKWLLRKFKNK